jgi:hypothetical protein
VRSFPGDDPVLEHLTGAEGQDPAWWDRRFNSGPGISANALGFIAQQERAET